MEEFKIGGAKTPAGGEGERIATASLRTGFAMTAIDYRKRVKETLWGIGGYPPAGGGIQKAAEFFTGRPGNWHQKDKQ